MVAHQELQSNYTDASEFDHPVVRRLSVEQAGEFLAALQSEFDARSRDGVIPKAQLPRGADQIVRWLSAQDNEEPLKLIRRALERLDVSARALPGKELWEAACSVYCLAASRAIGIALRPEQVSGHRVSVPDNCDRVCAGIIALAREGGRLVLEMPPGRPAPDHVPEISVAENGDHSAQALRRSIFAAVGKNVRQAPLASFESRDLDVSELERLRVWVDDIRDKKRVFAVLVRNAVWDNSLEEFSKALSLPLVLVSARPESESVLDAKRVAGLRAHMDLLWTLLGIVAQESPPSTMSPVVARQGTRSVLPETIPTNRLGLQKIAGCENSVRLMDIVFIHGLDGDAWASWMADPADTKTFWPYWLAEAFPRAGIWSLGYPAASLKWKEDAMPIETRAVQVLSLMALDQIGERPLVMVTHSMGGLLAKQMLRVASELQKPAYQQIARQTKSIAFISTPHSGSKLANFMTFFGFIARPNEQLVELTAHKAYLRSLHTWFLSYQKAHELVCLTYCETREVRVKRRPLSWLKKGLLVVDQGSADTGIPDEPPIPLDEDHISICKPASRSAQLYRGLVALLESCQARLAKTTAE